MVVTGINCITPLGFNAEITAANVRAGVSRIIESEDFYDVEGNPISISYIPDFDDNDDDDNIARFKLISEGCLKVLLEKYFPNMADMTCDVHLLLGVANLSRPGPRYEGKDGETAKYLAEILNKNFRSVALHILPSGNPAVIKGLEIANNLLKNNPNVICIVGGIDSLIAIETLNWFEEAGRLKSKTFGRNQSFAPGEAIGFMVIENKEAALDRKKEIIAEITGVAFAKEPAPFLSKLPSKGEGLTNACKMALNAAACTPSSISIVFGDLNGEFFRAKEWNYAAIRCFGNDNFERQLWHPAEFMGDVGAASGAILCNIAVAGLKRGWINKSALVFASDDDGECGALVLKRNSN